MVQTTIGGILRTFLLKIKMTFPTCLNLLILFTPFTRCCKTRKISVTNLAKAWKSTYQTENENFGQTCNFFVNGLKKTSWFRFCYVSCWREKVDFMLNQIELSSAFYFFIVSAAFCSSFFFVLAANAAASLKWNKKKSVFLEAKQRVAEFWMSVALLLYCHTKHGTAFKPLSRHLVKDS